RARGAETEEVRTPEERKEYRRRLFIAALLCGTVLAIASNLQQGGMQAGTDGGKAGFITALYIVLVPRGGLFLKKKVQPIFWLGVALAVVGLYLLCVSGSFSLTTGDLLTLACAFAFAVQILLIDRFAPNLDSIELCAAEFLVAGVWSLIGLVIFEKPDVSGVVASIPQVLYVAVFSSGVAYLLQILAQKDGDPSIVSLLFSMEAVFAVIASAIILHQRMSPREYLGCVLMLAAVVISQLPAKGKARE
ncbi:MAG: DMT family transporter, partial [Clostridia bacterium]|nr:DMT family transporter [Clostridia bacterium]